MKPKRDHFEGAVPAAEYFVTKEKTPTLKKVTESKLGYSIKVPKSEQRDAREQVIQNEILTYLRGRGIWCHKTKAINLVGSGDETALAATEKGVPDIVACYEGRFVAIEVKAAKTGKKVSGEQVAQLQAIESNGGFTMVAWSVAQVVDLLHTVKQHILT